MLLLFASCLNCSVHGAFLFCGEKLLQFIVKYKAVSVRAGGQWHFSPACQENPWVSTSESPGKQRFLGVLWSRELPSLWNRLCRCSPLGDVSSWALCLFMKVIILIKFIFFFCEQIVSSYLEWSLWKVRVEEQIMFTAILKKETWLFFVKCIFDWLIFTCDLLTWQMEIFRWTKC